MLFRLNYNTDSILLEAFLKAVGVNDDYQQIRFMIKDGEVKVNGRVEYARRRVLEIGDKVSFDGKHYIIAEDRDGDRPAVKPRRRMLPTDEGFDGVREHVQHKQKPLQWTEKKIKKKEKS